MIYFDNAATSWPKPPGVAEAMVHFIDDVGANRGRSAHRLAVESGRIVYGAREAVAELFKAPDPLRVVFGHNVTEALNLALRGLLHAGDHVVTSSMEHNSMMRPLRALEEQGVELTVVQCSPEGLLDPAGVEAAVQSMKKLNRDAAHLIQQVGANACTDITGFALLGHGYEMAEKSGVRLRFHVEQLPFVEGAVQYADEWLFPGGTCKNEQAYEHKVHFAPTIPEEMQQLLYTPETSGGLLVALPADRLTRLTGLFADEGRPCWIVGEVTEGEGVEVA